MFKITPQRSQQVFLTTIVVLSLALATVGGVFASSTSKPLATNFTLVNLSSTTANVSVAYYTDTGAVWNAAAANTNFTIAGNGGQAIVRQYTDGTLASGRGSAVVSSDQPLGSVVQILATYNNNGQVPTSGAYTGSSLTDSTYYVPLVLRRVNSASGLGNSQIMIQNADSSAINVDVQLVPAPGSGFPAFTKHFTNLPVGTTQYYDLDDELAGNVPAGWVGSAVVTGLSSKKIVVISNLFAGANTMSTFNGFPAGTLASDWFLPLFTSRLNNGLNTPVTVQNLSGGAAAAGTITLTCNKDVNSGGPSTYVTQTTTSVANNALWIVNPVTNNQTPNNWFGSCKVHGPGNVAAFAQLRSPGVNENADSYDAIQATGTDQHVLVPLVAKRLSNGFSTVVTIQNLNQGSAATVNLHYVAGGGSPGPATLDVNGLNIPAGGSLIRNHRVSSGPPAETGLNDGWFGTLTVTSTGAQAINAFVQYTNIQANSGDTTMATGVFTSP